MNFQEFLIKAKKATYANKNAQKKTPNDGSNELIFKEGDFFYRDRYFGGNPFLGEEIVFKRNKAIWGMNYQGKCFSKLKVKKVYSFLKDCLSEVNKNALMRGPKQIIKDELKYTNETKGDIDFFVGIEKIFIKDKLVYVCYYHGGLV